ncbi:hypothetical protein L1049_016416 [Liquidambar formosana]|uniref:Uncharacterized protein n=1 Tax=Liquidambar formosana TaxID=63359 RepID=A0AAP0S554_LIQFO
MQVVPGSTQIQDRTFNLPQQGAVSRSLTNFAILSQSGQFAVSQRINQQYQFEAPHNAQKGYGVVHGTDAPGFFGLPVLQQPKDPVTLSNQIHGANFSQSQSALQSAAEKVNLDLPN